MDDGFMPSLAEVRSPNSTCMLTYPQREPRHCSTCNMCSPKQNTLETLSPLTPHQNTFTRASCPKRRRRLRRNNRPLRASTVNLVADVQLLPTPCFSLVKHLLSQQAQSSSPFARSRSAS
jgi:hypothetical protein